MLGYDLIVSEQADENEITGWIDVMHEAMERSCPDHVGYFEF